ncbi:O-antigen polymerase [Vibrio cholerae]
MRMFFFPFFIFLCLFQPYVNGFSVFYLIISLPIVIFLNHKLLKIALEEFFLILCMFLLLFYFTAIGFFKSGIFNQRLIFVFILNIVIFLLAKLIVFYFLKNKNEEYLNRTVLYAITINSFAILFLSLGLISDSVFYSFITTNPLVFEYPIPRYPGFTYDAFSYVSTLTAFGFIFIFRNYFSFKKMTLLSMALYSIITLSAVVFSGRTGVALSLCYLVLFLFISKDKLRSINFLIISLSIFTIFFTISLGEYEWIKDWAFGFIRHIFSGESIQTSDSSVTGVLHSIFLPERIIFGDMISFSDVRSDLGFIRVFVSSGIVGLIVTFSLFFSPYFLVAFKCRSLTLFILTISLFFLNFKDVYLVSPYGHFMLLNLYFCYAVMSRRSANKFNRG